MSFDHRKAVGGHWDQVGNRHIRLLKAQGLRPHHYVLEFGCGSLRCGHRTIRYLNPGHYFGIEIDRRLLEAGIEHELTPQIVEDKQPAFAINGELRLAPEHEDQKFDFIVAQAVFTHFGPDALERFLMFALTKLAPRGRIILSLHIAPKDRLFLGKLSHYPNVVGDIRDLRVFAMRSVVYYPGYLLKQIAERLELGMTTLEWKHPSPQMSSQRMFQFVPTGPS